MIEVLYKCSPFSSLHHCYHPYCSEWGAHGMSLISPLGRAVHTALLAISHDLVAEEVLYSKHPLPCHLSATSVSLFHQVFHIINAHFSALQVAI